ncbi:uncharacterized protein BX664DRAFT_320607 [Halteromyces radiatus]|uniref:uncharacterized protein n=1 Tax=Halteromyces radiatus TaxID=101107 RepID=UPI0022203108|nr:uncharacterized protein BX664DRAFT_320607 [Halteromyces radiatus]KAI8099187.1 hypothetical protein BX664DRAFT_320607 [Halteromyces radiatus]
MKGYIFMAVSLFNFVYIFVFLVLASCTQAKEYCSRNGRQCPLGFYCSNGDCAVDNREYGKIKDPGLIGCREKLKGQCQFVAYHHGYCYCDNKCPGLYYKIMQCKTGTPYCRPDPAHCSTDNNCQEANKIADSCGAIY